MPSLLAFIQYSRHTEGVGIMDLDTWVSLGALLSVGAVLIGYIRASMRDLKDELKADIEKLDGKIDETRAETKIDIEKLDTKIDETRAETKIDIEKLDTKIDEARSEARIDIEKLDAKIDEARKEAKIDIEKLRHEVKSEIGALREHVDHGFARIDGRLDVLEQRTYDIKPTGT